MKLSSLLFHKAAKIAVGQRQGLAVCVCVCTCVCVLNQAHSLEQRFTVGDRESEIKQPDFDSWLQQ